MQNTDMGPAAAPPEVNKFEAGTWGIAEVAKFLGYAENTVKRLASEHPEKLPPRIRAAHKPRWLPEAVYNWAMEQSRPPVQAKVGRPRNQG